MPGSPLAGRPMPSPCRAASPKAPPEAKAKPADQEVDQIPDVLDTSAVKPRPGEIRISQEAINSRLRRVFTPNTRGQFKVSQEIIQQWKTKKGRKSLEQLFQSCGYDSDWV